MAALLERDRVGIKNITSKTTIPNTPTAKLMYYFNCVCTCVADSNEPEIQRLRDYKSNYNSLSAQEEAALLVLCLALSPDKLIGQVFFRNEDITGFTNAFYELSAVSTKMVVTESLLIGGQRKRVLKIMMFKKSWIEYYYLEPIKVFADRVSGRQRGYRALPPSRPVPEYSADDCCVIL